MPENYALTSAHFAAIIESSDDAIISKNLNGVIQSWNRGAELMFGYTADEMVGKWVGILIPAGQDNEEPEILGRIRRGLKVDHYETVRRRKDGSLINVSLTVSPIRDEAGKVVGASKIARNVTALKRAQERERTLISELVAASAKFQSVFDQTTIFAAITAIDGTVLDANKLSLQSCGYRAEDVLGRLFWETGWWLKSKESQEKIRTAVHQASEGISYRQTLTYWWADGTARVLDFMLHPIRDQTGQIIFLHPTGTDITDRIQTETELVEAMTAKDQFLAALSHELRTPLNPALLLASESAENPDLPHVVRSTFESIRKSIELEARLIDDLLDLTRITAGKMAFNRAPIELHEVLSDAAATIQAEQREKRIRLRMELNAECSMVSGDAVRLQQAFWNLLRNAIKFTPKDGTVVVETATEGDQLIVTVSDSGIGMSAGEISRAFIAFAQGDHARKGSGHRFGGLGLGLAICKRVIEVHNGQIRAESLSRNQGSTFVVELPLAHLTEPLQRVESLAQQRKEESAAVARPTMSILLVEDHAPTRTALNLLLVRRHYRVITAESVEEARIYAAQQKFDLLISDIGLPDGSGNDLMRELRDAYDLKGIALTGYGMEEDIARGKASGFTVHLVKPVNVQALESALRIIGDPPCP